MKNNTFSKEIENVLDTQNLGVLATRGEVYPYTSLVGFLPDEEYKNIVFATMKGTRKYANLIRCPEVSMLINSASNSNDDFKDAVSVTALGKSVELKDQDKECFKQKFLKKFPFLEDFVKDPGCALIALAVERYILVSRFQEVREFEV